MRNGPYLMVIAPEAYPGPKYRGRYCYEHRLVWWRTHGEVPEGLNIHHLNGDKHDNRPENLAAIRPGEHTALHHRMKSGRALRTCATCSKVFKPRRPGSIERFCSRPCIRYP